MYKRFTLVLLLLLMLPMSALAETVKGKLGEVSFQRGIVVVDGETYEVNTETTQVIYHGARLGEEDLRPGDDVELLISGSAGQGKERKPVLKAIMLIRGSKPGLES